MAGVTIMVDSCSHGRFPWLTMLVLSAFIDIDDIVAEVKVFLQLHGGRQMFLPNLAEPPHGAAPP